MGRVHLECNQVADAAWTVIINLAATTTNRRHNLLGAIARTSETTQRSPASLGFAVLHTPPDEVPPVTPVELVLA